MGSVSLIAVGDELLAGAHPDSNSPELAAALGRLGMAVRCIVVVPDDEPAIEAAVTRGLDESELVILSGGLGPTLDDVTRQGIASALDGGHGRSLHLDPSAEAGLKRWFQDRGRPMSDSNLRQALLPEGAQLLPNAVGTAPGFRVSEARGTVICLPGPPAEMRVVFQQEVEPWLIKSGRAQAPLNERRFHLFNLSESLFAEQVGDWMERDANPRMGCSVKRGVLSVVLRALGPGELALASLEARAEAFAERFDAYIFSRTEASLEAVLGAELLASGTSISLAESCTGGKLASLLTEHPGISRVFEHGFVTYSNAAKERDLGVDAALLREFGAVSCEVAGAMARGAAQAAGSELALSVTGIAGPAGGTDEKPVGLVCFGSYLRGEVRTSVRRFPPGERGWIRSLAARQALFLGLLCLRGKNLALDGMNHVALD